MRRMLFMFCFFLLMVILALVCNSTGEKREDQPPMHENWLFQGSNVGILAEERTSIDQEYYRKLHIIIDGAPVWSSDSNQLFVNRKGILPIVRKHEEHGTEILLGISNGKADEKILKLKFVRLKLSSLDTLPMY